MTFEERLQFAEMCSRDSSTLGGFSDAGRLTQALCWANQRRNVRLYRYRSVNENSLEELLFCYIYAGPACRFNDPLDCKPLVDRSKLPSLFRELYNDYKISDTDLVSSLNKQADEHEKWFREAAHVACLCEDYDNELMWAHYSENHKGFVLGYDIPKEDATNTLLHHLYPVIYSDKPMSVCAEADIDVVQSCYARITGIPQKPITNNFGSYMTAIYKRECWHYEKEWRLLKIVSLDGSELVEHIRVWLKPRVIYYGKDIEVNDEIRLHTYALMNGLEEYKMQYECIDGTFVLKSVPYKSKFDDQCRRFIKAHYKVVLMSRAKFADEALREIENECGDARPEV